MELQTERAALQTFWDIGSCLAPVGKRYQVNLYYEKQEKLTGTKLCDAMERLCSVSEPASFRFVCCVAVCGVDKFCTIRGCDSLSDY